MNLLRFWTTGFVLLLTAGWSSLVWGKPEAAMLSPVSRSAMWAFLGNAKYANQLKPNHDYYTRLNCNGAKTTMNDFEDKCGPCGDHIKSSRPNEAGGVFAIGQVVALYHEGSQINVTIDVKKTGNSGGMFRFSLCKTDRTTQVSHNCFAKHVLNWHGTQMTWIPAPEFTGLATYTLQLPQGVICRYCVLQWLWREGRDSSEPKCKPSKSTNCGERTIANCADIRILRRGSKFPSDFDRPRYDDYSSIYTANDKNNHGDVIHSISSSRLLRPFISPGMQPSDSVQDNPSGPNPSDIIQGSTRSEPIVIAQPGNGASGTSSPSGNSGSDEPSSSGNTSSSDEDSPPSLAQRLLGPVVAPAAGTAGALAFGPAAGIALLLFALSSYNSPNDGFGSAYTVPPTTFYSRSSDVLLSPLQDFNNYFAPAIPSLLTPPPQTASLPFTVNSGIATPAQLSSNIGQQNSNVFGQSVFFQNPVRTGAETLSQGPLFSDGVNIPMPFAFNTANAMASGSAIEVMEPIIFNDGVSTVMQPPFINNDGVLTPSFTGRGIGQTQQVQQFDVNGGFQSLALSPTAIPLPQQSGNSNTGVATSRFISRNRNGFNVSPQQFPARSSGIRTTLQQSPVVNNNNAIPTLSQQQTLNSNTPVINIPKNQPNPSAQGQLLPVQQVNNRNGGCDCRPIVEFLTVQCFMLRSNAKACSDDSSCYCKFQE